MAKKRRKAKKRTVKNRRTAQRPVSRKKRVSKKKSSAKKTKKKGAKTRRSVELPAEPVGRVTHYFPQVKAAAVRIEREGVRVGDTLYFKGHTTQFKQKVESLQIDRQVVSEAGPESEVGIQVRSRTREHDLVFKL